MKIYFTSNPPQPIAERPEQALQTWMAESNITAVDDDSLATQGELYEDAIKKVDGVVMTLEQPSAEQEARALRAHELGKSVLLFIPGNVDPNEFLPAFAPFDRHETEERYKRAYWIDKSGQKGNEVSIHTGHLREMKLKVWLGAQLIRFGVSDVFQSDEFQVELADKSRHVSGTNRFLDA
jgi:hypothetical protein